GNELDADDLCRWGELLSGQRVQDAGVINLTPAEWLDRWQDFRRRHPDFAPLADADAARARHNQEGRAPEREANWQAAMFHLDRLVALDPDSAPLYSRRARANAELGRWLQSTADKLKAAGLQRAGP